MNTKIQYISLFLILGIVLNINAQGKIRYIKIPNEKIYDVNSVLTQANYDFYVKQSLGENRVNKNAKEGVFVHFEIRANQDDSIKTYISLLNESSKLANDFQNEEIVETKAKHHFQLLNSSSGDKINSVFKNQKNGDKIIYIHENHLIISKILNQKIIADSVKIRTITVDNEEDAKDILKKIESGTITWAAAADKYDIFKSNTPQNKDSEFISFGKAEKDINEYCFYYAKKGETKLIITQFGFHIIQVLESKFITNQTLFELLTFKKQLILNENSKNEASKKAQDFINKCPNIADFQKEVSLLNNKTEKFSSLRQVYSYDIVNWLQNTEVGKISPTPFLDEGGFSTPKYTVAIVTNIRKDVPYQEIFQGYEGTIRQFVQKYNFESSVKEQSLEAVANKYHISIESIENIESSKAEFLENEDFMESIEKDAAYPTLYESLNSFYLIKIEE